MSFAFSSSQSGPHSRHHIAALLVCCFSLASARSVLLSQLPYVNIEEGTHGGVSLLERSGAEADAWWAQVGDRMYHTPSRDAGLSRNIKDYYVTLGTTAAMPDEMRAHYVGGQGRWNILHLPEGPSMLKVHSNRDRRSAFSSLSQLGNGMVLKKTFPTFELKQDYSSGLDEAGHKKERDAVASLTPEAVQKTLTEFVNFEPSRSYQDKGAQQHAIDFVQRKFKEMGLATSLQQFSMGSISQTNVVACIAGKSSDSVTVGAHYDSRPYEGAAPGAEDNGSGVAVMLNIAKAFANAKASPTKTVYFVGFAAEEPGLLGSKAFVEELKAGGQKFPEECRPASHTQDSFLQARKLHGDTDVHHRAIVLDEVGWKSPSLPKLTLNLESFDWTDHDVIIEW